jgi:hypothetical protein
LLCAVASIGAVAITGCGSSSNSSTTGATTSAAAPAAATTSAAAPAGNTSAAPSGGAASNPAVAQAVAACKSSINAAPTLTADEKSKLTAICDKAANGDEAGVKQAASQVCMEIVKSTVPSSAQSTALAACPKP